MEVSFQGEGEVRKTVTSSTSYERVACRHTHNDYNPQYSVYKRNIQNIQYKTNKREMKKRGSANWEISALFHQISSDRKLGYWAFQY